MDGYGDGNSGSVEGGVPGAPVVVVVVGGRRPAAITSPWFPGRVLSGVEDRFPPSTAPFPAGDGDPPGELSAASPAGAPLPDIPWPSAGTWPPDRTVVVPWSEAAHQTPPIRTNVASTAQPIR